MRIVFVGGGTGGHLYPAFAIARELLREESQAEVLFIGTNKGLEAQLVPQAGFPLATISAQGLARRLTWTNVQAFQKNLRGLRQARKILRQFKPDFVIGTGGYVCGPVVFMAHILGIPTAIHEQNALPGLTNRFLARWVDLVMTTYAESQNYFPAKTRVELTGFPVRAEILAIDRLRAAKELRLDPQVPTVLVMGGSLGARSINQAMAQLIPNYALQSNRQIIHVTGKAGYAEMQKELEDRGLVLAESGNIRVVPYIHHMEYSLALADLIVCRAGAATLAEVTAKGIPGILIPYPKASENHQEYNARILEKHGAAKVILDRELEGSRLLAAIEEVLAQPNQLSLMAKAAQDLASPGAAEKICQLLKNLS